MVNEDNKNLSSQNQDNLDLDVSDEIVVRDKDGSFKVLIGGKLKKLDGEEVRPAEVKLKQAEPPSELFKKEGIVPEEPLTERLAPPPPAPWHKTEGAAFYFHPEDEEEVQKLVSHKGLAGFRDVSKEVDKIMQTSKLSIVDAVRLKRVRNILESYLKHVRDKADSHEILVRDESEGGAGLDENSSDDLLVIAESVLLRLDSGEEVTAPESELDKLIKQSDDIYDFSKVTPKPTAVETTHSDVLAEEIAVRRPELTKQPQLSEPEIEIPPAPTPPLTRAKVIRPSLSDSARPRMADVIPSVKLRGPIAELKYMSLTELRRLGASSLDNIANIKNKIEALEDESFAKKVEGIKAWRQSPLYMLYVDIGRASMEQGKAISQIITARQGVGEETLTLQEFEKISDLNQELRY